MIEKQESKEEIRIVFEDIRSLLRGKKAYSYKSGCYEYQVEAVEFDKELSAIEKKHLEGKETSVCCNCGEVFIFDEDTCEMYQEKPLCQDCYQVDYGYCNICGKLEKYTEMDLKEIICLDCLEKLEEENKRLKRTKEIRIKGNFEYKE